MKFPQNAETVPDFDGYTLRDTKNGEEFDRHTTPSVTLRVPPPSVREAKKLLRSRRPAAELFDNYTSLKNSSSSPSGPTTNAMLMEMGAGQEFSGTTFGAILEVKPTASAVS